MSRPLVVDLYCGLGGWAQGFLAEQFCVIGFDIEQRPYPGQLVLQDVATLHGSQFRNATCIVASPPCQSYSYRAMPWKRAKALPPPDNTLFEACFRIQREASEAAGRYIPMVVENVCGAQKWVGRAAWHYGSYYLWGDVPALMPFAQGAAKVPGLDWNGSDKPGYKAQAFNTTAEQRMREGVKVPGMNFHDHEKTGKPGRSFQSAAVASTRAVKATDPSYGTRGWFGPNGGTNVVRDANGHGVKGFARRFEDTPWAWYSSRSEARKQASAEIAKIPFDLAQWIARCFYPRAQEKSA